MRFHKKLLTVVFFILLLAFPLTTLAEDEVKVEIIETDPVELTESGIVTVTFEISNHSDYELSDLMIVQGDFIYQIPQETIIPVFGSAKIPIAISVADSQIGIPLIFKVSWNCAGEPYFVNKELTIGRAVEPVISLSRSVAESHARTGETVTIVYTLKNETRFDMTDIMLIDEQISNDPIRRDDTLRANDSFQIEYTYTMGTFDVVSAPVVTYVVNDKTKSFSSVEPITISMVNINISLDVEKGTPSSTGVPFTLLAKNLGNQKVTDLVIRDERGNIINNTPFSLEPNGTQTLSCTIAPAIGETARNVSFQMSGTDPFGDLCETAPTASHTIFPYVDDSQIQVSILGTIVTEWTAQSGTVGVRMLIQNNSSVDLTNAVLSEASLGTLQTFSVLSSGQTVYESDLVIGSPRNLSFTLRAVDPAGTERMAAETILNVAYPEATETPTSTPQASQQQDAASTVGTWSNLITRILIIMGAIMIIAFAILLILTILERSHSASAAFIDQEDDLLFDEMFDEVETKYDPTTEDIPADEFGEPLSNDYLQRAKLYVPQNYTPRTNYHKTSNAPSYDELMSVGQTTGYYKRTDLMQTQKTLRIPGGSNDISSNTLRMDSPQVSDPRNASESYYSSSMRPVRPRPSGISLEPNFNDETKNYFADGIEDVPLQAVTQKHHLPSGNAPKHVSTQPRARATTQKKPSIKRVMTNYDDKR